MQIETIIVKKTSNSLLDFGDDLDLTGFILKYL